MRPDCPLITLGLVLAGAGFPPRGKILARNVSEPGASRTGSNTEKLDAAFRADDSSNRCLEKVWSHGWAPAARRICTVSAAKGVYGRAVIGRLRSKRTRLPPL